MSTPKELLQRALLVHGRGEPLDLLPTLSALVDIEEARSHRVSPESNPRVPRENDPRVPRVGDVFDIDLSPHGCSPNQRCLVLQINPAAEECDSWILLDLQMRVRYTRGLWHYLVDHAKIKAVPDVAAPDVAVAASPQRQAEL
jgi:hypothetical protein